MPKEGTYLTASGTKVRFMLQKDKFKDAVSPTVEEVCPGAFSMVLEIRPEPCIRPFFSVTDFNGKPALATGLRCRNFTMESLTSENPEPRMIMCKVPSELTQQQKSAFQNLIMQIKSSKFVDAA